MSGEYEITSVDDFLGEVLAGESESATMERAAEDPVVRGVLGLFATHGYEDESAKAIIRDVLEQRIVTKYNVRPERSEEVFEKVEESIRQEAGTNGTA